MRKDFLSHLGSLGRCSEAEPANRVTSGSLSETIGRMWVHREIQAIESQTKRMGTNACIQSAQTGAAGDALGVLAASIQQLAPDSTRRSESLINGLESMSEAALHLLKQGAPASASRTVVKSAIWKNALRGRAMT